MKNNNISETPLDTALNQLINVHMQCLNELEHYIYYIARCLKEKFNQNELVNLMFQNIDGMAQAVVYPKSSIVEGEGVVNPMFFYGYILEIKEDGMHLFFTEDFHELDAMVKAE